MSSIKTKYKPCKAIGKAKDFEGCGKNTLVRKYGLCKNCLREWVKSTPEGVEFAQSFALNHSKKLKEEKKKEEKEEFHQMKIRAYSNKYKKLLQDNINLLAREIDKMFKYRICIDCDRGYGAQTDGSHFHNVNGNENLRFNLDNIHSANSFCNQYHGGRKEEYYTGLVERYGKDYADYVKFELPLKYPYIGLKEQDYYDKLTIVRKLLRELKTYQFKDSIHARKMLNRLINIYK